MPALRLDLARRTVLHRPGGDAVALYARDAALLAWLAIEGPTPRARLATLLWPDSPVADARNTLRQRLFQLKKQVGAAIVIGDATLALADDVAHDLADSDTLLGGEPHDYSAELAAWLARERARRAGRAQQSLAARIDAAEQAGDFAGALALAEELLAHEPLSEAAHRRVIRLHYLNRDRAAALLAFDRCERVLKDEVGTKPSAETLALLAQVSSAAAPAAAAPAPVPATVLRPPQLVGREHAWSQMQAGWQARRVVLLAGEGGLGKSRLLSDFAAACDAPLVTAGARPGDALLPYALLSRLLRAVLARGLVPAEGVRRELARLLPELGEARSPAAAAERTRFVNAVEATLAQAAADGLAGVLIDDLHLADAASVELLLPLAVADGGAALRWIVAFRDVELPAAAHALLDELVTSHRALTLALAPLTVQDVAALLDSLGIGALTGAAHAAALHRRTGGNPLYLLEAVKAQLTGYAGSAGDPDLPVAVPAIDQIILRRLGRLSSDAVKLARCAAVAGQDFSAALASSVLSVAPLDLADRWNELEAAQVLRGGGFAHDLIHEAALASVPAPIARELHAQIARFMQGRDGDASRIAAHWRAAGEHRLAAPHLIAAARLAFARFRFAESAEGYAQAAQILEAADEPDAAFDAWFCAADALFSVGGSRVADFADRMDALARSDEQIAKAALARSSLEIEAGRLDTGLRVAERGLAAARRAGREELQSDLLFSIGVVHWDRREIARSVLAVEEAIRIRRALPPETMRADHQTTTIVMVQSYGTILGGAGRFADAMAQLIAAYELATAAGQPQMILGAAADLVLRFIEYGDLPAALTWTERGQCAADEASANATELLRFWMARAGAFMVAGQWGEALAQYERVRESIERAGPARLHSDIVTRLGHFHALLGRPDLTLKTGRAELARDDVSTVQRLMLDATLAALPGGSSADADALLERVAAVEDIGVRARMLVRLAPRLSPASALPLLGVTATAMREGGLAGQAMTLQARIAALLAAARRHADATAAARLAWAEAERGVTPTVPPADFFNDLQWAFERDDPTLAQSLRQRAAAWLQSAAATLPLPWRDSCTARSVIKPRLRRIGAA
ncbi:MAG: AAA family ATPase [Burkholderiaceae bacterium]|nr:AAA family ATPase [Burkholderiaceae bacterium]